MKRDATEAEADKAVARLMPMIEAANASNQAGEDAVVAIVHAYDCHSGLVTALEQIANMRGWATWTDTPEKYVSTLATVAALALAKAKGSA